jgi:hypothetical protein
MVAKVESSPINWYGHNWGKANIGHLEGPATWPISGGSGHEGTNEPRTMLSLAAADECADLFVDVSLDLGIREARASHAGHRLNARREVASRAPCGPVSTRAAPPEPDK